MSIIVGCIRADSTDSTEEAAAAEERPDAELTEGLGSSGVGHT